MTESQGPGPYPPPENAGESTPDPWQGQQQPPPGYGQQPPPGYGQQPPPGYGQQLPPGSYGRYGAPMPPVGYPDAQPAGPAPASVLTAVRLMFVVAGLGLLGVLLAFTQKDALRSALVARDGSLAGTRLDSALSAAIGIAVGISIVVVVLYVLLALQVRKGKNWARIVTWVLAGFGILGALASLGQPTAPLSRILGLINGALYVAITVLLAQKASGAYFVRRRQGY